MTGSRALFVTYTILTLSASAIYQQTSKAEPESPPLIPVYSFKVLSFPSADKVTTLANLAQPERVTFTPDSAQSAVNMLLKAVTEKCGWPDPAILVWIAKKQGNEQLRANTGTFDNLPTGHVSVIFPSCVYLSPSEATIKAAKSGETSDLIPSDSVREFVSKNAQNISDSIWALPVEQRLGLVQGRDFLVNVEPGLKETTSISQTSNAQEAIDIASGVIRGTISLATYEQRRNALFSRIVSETTRALKDPQKRSAISRTSIQHFGEQKISFISGTTADELRDQLKDAFEIIDDTPKEFLEYDPNNPASIAAAKECESGLGNAASSRTWPVPVHRIIDAIERNHFQRVKRTGSVEDETPVLVADTGYPELLLERIGSHWDEVAANRDYYFPDSLWFTVQDKLGGRKDKLGADVTKDELSYNVEPPDADKYAAAHHGMWVASLVLGGFDLRFFRSNEVLPIRVHFAKLLTLKSDGSKYIIPREAIARAVQYAFQHKIQIVNLSVSTNRELSQLKGLLEGAKEAKNLLVVSAAGEDAVDLRSEGRWPARYGGGPWSCADRHDIHHGGCNPGGRPTLQSVESRGGICGFISAWLFFACSRNHHL